LFTQQDIDAPVSEGAIHDVIIDEIARKGDGIARIKGFVVFVPETQIGDRVKIKIEKVMRKCAIAAITEQ